MLMTPGPTDVPKRVRERMRRPIHNPDVDPDFADFYRSVTDKLGDVYDTDDDLLVLGGEGILGLEASIASLIEAGDRVLCISNGLYGDGFADFVETYDGEPVTCDVPYGEALDAEQVKDALEDDDFAAATVVHCETPTGTLNDIEEILGVLSDAGVLTIVDAVSSLGGAPVPVENIDVCIGASQKCFSSPPGLTTLSVSDGAWERVEETETRSFYANLEPWKEMWLENDRFPYTQLPSNLYALDESLDMILEAGLDEVFARHEEVAEFCRQRAAEMGFDLYPADEALSSPTVTALDAEGRATELQERLDTEHGITVGVGLGDMEDDVLRIGHMGYNADRERVETTMRMLEDVLEGE